MDFFKMVEFHDPAWLVALLLLPVVAWQRGQRGAAVLVVPNAAAWYRPGGGAVAWLPVALMYGGLALLAVAMARPQRLDDKVEEHKEGYDIILAVDLSGSMRAEDYSNGFQRLNRLQAIQPVIEAFIENRADDRIGIVLFAGRAYTLAPLTFDYEWLKRQTERMKIGMLEEGTAIGDALGVAVSRLSQKDKERDGKRKGAFVILLTDGSNNRGTLEPVQAAELARDHGVPVYTIGAGSGGVASMPVMDEAGNVLGYQRMPSDLDEPLLQEIAGMTGGKFFRARDVGTVEGAFAAIDKATKVEFDAKRNLRRTELFFYWAAPGIFLVLAAGLLTVRSGREGVV